MNYVEFHFSNFALLLLLYILSLAFYIRRAKSILSRDLTAPVNTMSVAEIPYLRVVRTIAVLWRP